ncbi:MAG: hypothetical protein U5K69_09710 [Balneolaceae bacterium]|nr:hypothetical protein [Balneolaceae bacterium]
MTASKAIKRVKEVKRNNQQVLDLSELQLTSEELPEELFDLPNLRDLNLSHNRLSSLPVSSPG